VDYTYKDIREAYKKLGIEKKRVVLARTDLRNLGRYESIDNIMA